MAGTTAIAITLSKPPYKPGSSRPKYGSCQYPAMIIGTSRASSGAQPCSGGNARPGASAGVRSAKIDAPPAIEYTASAGPRKIGAKVDPVARYAPTPTTVAMKAARGQIRRVATPSPRRVTAGNTHGEGSMLATIWRGGP